MHRRTFLLTSLLPALLASTAEAAEIDLKQTFVLQRDGIKFAPWRGCRPARRMASSMEMSTSRALPCLDEVEPRLVQRAAQLCHRSYPNGHVGYMVGQQWRRLHTGYGGAGASRRLCQANARTFHYDGVPHGIKGPVVIASSALARSTSGSPIRICQRGGRFEAPRPCTQDDLAASINRRSENDDSSSRSSQNEHGTCRNLWHIAQDIARRHWDWAIGGWMWVGPTKRNLLPPSAPRSSRASISSTRPGLWIWPL